MKGRVCLWRLRGWGVVFFVCGDMVGMHNFVQSELDVAMRWDVRPGRVCREVTAISVSRHFPDWSQPFILCWWSQLVYLKQVAKATWKIHIRYLLGEHLRCTPGSFVVHVSNIKGAMELIIFFHALFILVSATTVSPPLPPFV